MMRVCGRPCWRIAAIYPMFVGIGSLAVLVGPSLPQANQTSTKLRDQASSRSQSACLADLTVRSR